jgi:Na+-translocating ferredoxin:NAD+ oxidoreductase RnfG subunit
VEVKKDGGDLDGITGATISSRAVAEAAGEGIEVFGRHKAEIEATGQ